MPNTKSLAEIIRRIQELTSLKNPTSEQVEELDFYVSLKNTLVQIFTPGNIGTLMPIHFSICTLERAQEIAKSIGLFITESGSGTIYVNWSKGLAVD